MTLDHRIDCLKGMYTYIHTRFNNIYNGNKCLTILDWLINYDISIQQNTVQPPKTIMQNNVPQHGKIIPNKRTPKTAE